MTSLEFMLEWRSPSPFVEVQTSGSTGAPKRMVVEKRRMEASATITCDFLALEKHDKALLCLSADYIAGKMMIVRSLVRGMQLTDIGAEGHPLRQIDGDFDLAAMVPMQIYNTLSSSVERERLGRIRNVLIGGGAISAELEKRLCAFPNNIWVTYGMTETLSHIALRRVGKPWYLPFDSVNVSLSDEGCLVVDAPLVCPQVLVTNDMAELAPDGRGFRILGRKGNAICSGGIKMQMEDIEQRLASFMDFPFMITKRADEKFGEVVVMLYTISAEEHVRVIAESVLPKYMQPKLYIRLDRLPYTYNGKPARRTAMEIAKDKGSAAG